MSDAFWSWLETGYDNGWCSDLRCETHEGLPWTEEEELEWEEGNDFCVVAVRIYGTERVDEAQSSSDRANTDNRDTGDVRLPD